MFGILPGLSPFDPVKQMVDGNAAHLNSLSPYTNEPRSFKMMSNKVETLTGRLPSHFSMRNYHFLPDHPT